VANLLKEAISVKGYDENKVIFIQIDTLKGICLEKMSELYDVAQSFKDQGISTIILPSDDRINFDVIDRDKMIERVEKILKYLKEDNDNG
jgi:hypothetical protein